MPRKMFEQSAQTKAIVSLFLSLKYDEQVSFADASKVLRFHVTSTTPAYQTAKRIAERDHGVFIYSVRGVGFGRGNGSAMVASGAGLFERVKRIGKATARRMLTAIEENLSEDEHRQATDMYARANIIAATSSGVHAASNRERRRQGQKADPFDLSAALKQVTGGNAKR